MDFIHHLSIIYPLLMFAISYHMFCQEVPFHEKSPPSSSGPWLVQTLVFRPRCVCLICANQFAKRGPAVGAKPTSGASQRAGKEGRILLEKSRDVCCDVTVKIDDIYVFSWLKIIDFQFGLHVDGCSGWWWWFWCRTWAVCGTKGGSGRSEQFSTWKVGRKHMASVIHHPFVIHVLIHVIIHWSIISSFMIHFIHHLSIIYPSFIHHLSIIYPSSMLSGHSPGLSQFHHVIPHHRFSRGKRLQQRAWWIAQKPSLGSTNWSTPPLGRHWEVNLGASGCGKKTENLWCLPGYVYVFHIFLIVRYWYVYIILHWNQVSTYFK